MKRNHWGITVGLLAALLVTSCQGMFDGNIFDAVDKPTLDPDELSKASLEDLETLAESDKFFEELREDDEALGAVATNLLDIQENGSPEEVTDASLLLIDVMLWGTGAGDAANTLLTTLLSADQASITDNANPEGLQNLLRDAFGTDPEEIIKSLFALQKIHESLLILEASDDLDQLSGDMVSAAPFAALANMLLTSVDPALGDPMSALVGFIIGNPTDLESTFELTTLDPLITSLNGSFEPEAGDVTGYEYLNDIVSGII